MYNIFTCTQGKTLLHATAILSKSPKAQQLNGADPNRPILFVVAVAVVVMVVVVVLVATTARSLARSTI